MTTEEYIKLRKLHLETMKALHQQQEQLRQIRKKQSWWLDVGSNVAGNGIYDIIVWIGSRLIKKL